MKKERKNPQVSPPPILGDRGAQTPLPGERGGVAPILIAIGSVAFVIVAYVFCVSGGTFHQWQQRSWGYSLLADGFMRGHTYLIIPPPAGLLALPDPYDPDQNHIYAGGDASLYNGHFYYYFGPLPSLILVLWKMCLDKPTTILGDQYLVFIFMIGMLAAVALLIVRWRRLFFPEAPAWTLAPAIIAAGMSLPLTWLPAHPAMLESAIAGGQCFMLLGLYFAMVGIQATKPKWSDLGVAGMFWAMAWGCRLSIAPAIGAMTLLTLLELRGGPANRRELREWIKPGIALVAPLVIATFALLSYNHARFDSWTQTGWDYQLAWMNHHALAGKGIIVSPRYIPANLYRYLIELPQFSKEFPFLLIQKGAHGLVRRFPPPFLFALEPTAGILWSAPFCLLAVGLFLPVRRELPDSLRPRGTSHAGSPRLLRWATLSLLAACVLAMAPVLCGIGSVERYLADGAPSIMLLAVLGAWRLLDLARAKPYLPWLVASMIVTLAATTATFGILLLFGPA